MQNSEISLELKALFDKKMFVEIYEKRKFFSEHLKNDVTMLNLLGLSCFATNEFKDAIIYFLQATSSTNFNVEFNYNLGRTYFESKKYKRAIKIFCEIIEREPKFLKARYNLGLSYMKEGLFEDAEACFKYVQAFNPNFNEAYYHEAICLESRGCRKLAINTLRESPKNAEMYKFISGFSNFISCKDYSLNAPDGTPIYIVTATKNSDEEFFSKTLLGKSIKNIMSSDMSLNLTASNKRGLPAVFNEAIRACNDDDAIFVFIHDDVFILDFFWLDKVFEGLETYDVVGLVGSKTREGNQPSWYYRSLDEKIDIAEASGMIGHGPSPVDYEISYFNKSNQKVKILDGLFLAIRLSTINANNLFFDERFEFHLYDVDFCRQAEEKSLTCGTIPVAVVHSSGGNFDETWRFFYKRYCEKWS